MKDYKKYFIFVIAVLAVGCANQIPPSGGDEDKTPPKIVKVEPNENSLHVSGREILLEFSEFVDRRSFQDAIKIYPVSKEVPEFNWSGKSVEVKFSKSFKEIFPNKTIIVSINNSFRDINGNQLTEPISFAFSTGGVLDSATISGKVYNHIGKIISVYAYRIINESSFNPTINLSDYTTQTNTDGSYVLNYLAPGNYKLVALEDDDRNFLYTEGRENFGVLSSDVNLGINVSIVNKNFYINQVNQSNLVSPELDYKNYFPDSVGIISTSISYGTRAVLPEQSIFIFFNKHKPSRESLPSIFKLQDEYLQDEKLIFNWRNDSLVEIFSVNKFSAGRSYNLSIKLPVSKDSVYKFNLKFKTLSVNSFGDVKGIVQGVDAQRELPVVFSLSLLDSKPEKTFSSQSFDTVFTISKLPEGDYSMFSFIDSDNSGTFDFGLIVPFRFSEPFYVYPSKLQVKAGWSTENVLINFK